MTRRFLIRLFLALALCALTGCEGSVAVVGGADGPTAYFFASGGEAAETGEAANFPVAPEEAPAHGESERPVAPMN